MDFARLLLHFGVLTARTTTSCGSWQTAPGTARVMAAGRDREESTITRIGGAHCMRHGKNPTSVQKRLLQENGLDAKRYLYVGEADDGRKVVFRDRETGEEKALDKN